jgi:predicted nucleic acid-binding protein
VVQEQARHARADDAVYTPGISTAELVRRHAKKKVEKDLESIHTLKALLDVTERWTVESPKWVLTVVEIKKRKYQLALDALEQIFELTKMNQSQTGGSSIY